jgi:hypothetical protein
MSYGSHLRSRCTGIPTRADGLQSAVGQLHIIMLLDVQDFRLGYVKPVPGLNNLVHPLPETIGHPKPKGSRTQTS